MKSLMGILIAAASAAPALAFNFPFLPLPRRPLPAPAPDLAIGAPALLAVVCAYVIARLVIRRHASARAAAS